jgi:hypothetical protein
MIPVALDNSRDSTSPEICPFINGVSDASIITGSSYTILNNIGNRLIRIKNYCFTNLPDRTKIFLSALWFWIYITYYFNSMICYFLKIILMNTPDSCIAFQSKLIKKKENTPEIIEATLGKEIITNKIKLLINLCWDKEISDVGGLNIKDLVSKYSSLSTSVIWISYLFNLEKKMQDMTDEEIGKKVKYMLINITDKIIYRDDGSACDDEEIIFGEIPF